MERLSGLDASFLYLESPEQPMNVMAIIEIDPITIPGGYDFESMRAEIGRRAAAMPRFRRKLDDSIVNLGHPVWIEDTDFDVADHVHRAALPAPGADPELAELCAHLAEIPLDRSRPLWDMWIVEGRAESRLAVILRTHHADTDGNGGAELIAQLCGLTPEPPELDERLVAASVGGPAWTSMVLGGAVGMLRRPLTLAQMTSRTAAISLRWLERAIRSAAMPAPLTAPRTPFNSTITGHRAVAFTQVSLDDVRRIKSHFGVTINDVVLATGAGAVRELLVDRDALPDRPLVGMVPVSITGDVPDGGCSVDELGSNLVTGMFVSLPTDVADPVARMYAMAQSATTAKDHHATVDPNLLRGWAQLSPATTAHMISKIYTATHFADHHPVIYNLVMSNVHGPDAPLYFLGARITALFPFGPVFHGAGLNITVFSTGGNLNVGIIGCAEQIPDPAELARGFERGIKTLLEACDEV